MAGYKIITHPVQEPVSVSEARLFLSLGSDTSHDTLISMFITSARQQLERSLNRALITQTIEDEYTFIPSNGVFTLRFCPIQSIQSFRVFDHDDMECDISRYWKDLVSEPCTIAFQDKSDIPSNIRAIKIKYVAGYGNDAAVPTALKEAILVQVRESFDCRMNGVTEPGMTVSDRIAQTYRVWHPDTNVN